MLLCLSSLSSGEEIPLTRQLPYDVLSNFADEYEKCAANFFFRSIKEAKKFNIEGFRDYKNKSGEAKAYASIHRGYLLKRDGYITQKIKEYTDSGSMSEAELKRIFLDLMHRADEISNQKIKTYLKSIERRSPEGLDIASSRTTDRCLRALEELCVFFWELGYACGRSGD